MATKSFTKLSDCDQVPRKPRGSRKPSPAPNVSDRPSLSASVTLPRVMKQASSTGCPWISTAPLLQAQVPRVRPRPSKLLAPTGVIPSAKRTSLAFQGQGARSVSLRGDGPIRTKDREDGISVTPFKVPDEFAMEKGGQPRISAANKTACVVLGCGDYAGGEALEQPTSCPGASTGRPVRCGDVRHAGRIGFLGPRNVHVEDVEREHRVAARHGVEHVLMLAE